MATEAERMRQDIASTRAELARDLDQVARQTSPGRLASRAKGFLAAVKDRVVGTSEQAASTVADAASDLTDQLQRAPRTVARATKGSPIGVGLIAFGSGILAATLIPETEVERRAAQQVAEHAGPVVAPLLDAGRDVAADVRDVAAAAGEQVRTAFEPVRRNT